MRTYERRGSHRFTGYCCKTYKTQGKARCRSHAVGYAKLCEAVLRSVREETEKLLTAKDIAYLGRVRSECVSGSRKDCETQIIYLEREIGRREAYKKKTYQNYLEEVISKEEYLSYAGEFERELTELRKQLERRKNMASEAEQRMEDFENYIHVEELTREMVTELIERIEVNEDGSVNIFYKFRDKTG